MAGLATMISYFKLVNFICVTGTMLFANKKAMPVNNKAKRNRGRIKRIKGIPAALIATNSKLSPKFPNVMMEEKSNAKGSAVVKILTDTSPISCNMINKPRPFPTKSSMYNQKNCMVSTKVVISSAAKKGPIKAFRISMSNFLNKVCSTSYRYDEKVLLPDIPKVCFDL